MVKYMRKIIILVVSLILIFGLSGCKPKTYDEINLNELNTMLENKEDFVLMLGATHCSACSAFKITLNKIVEEYGIDIKYIDNDKLTETEQDELLSKFYFSSTPTTVFVRNGKESDRMVGNQKFSKTVSILKEKEYIKE